MIDTRNYKTHEELLEAMQFEHDCAEVEYLNAKISKMKTKFTFYKHEYEYTLQILNFKKDEAAKRINEYHRKRHGKVLQ